MEKNKKSWATPQLANFGSVEDITAAQCSSVYKTDGAGDDFSEQQIFSCVA